MKGVAGAVIAAIIIGTLYLGREVFVPIALAILLSFVLAPLVRLLQAYGFELRRQNGSKRFYDKADFAGFVQVDCHGKKEVPTGTLNKILKDAHIQR